MTNTSFPDTLIDGVPVVATPAEIDITTADQLHAVLFPDTLIDGVPVVTTPAEIDITTADQLHAVLLRVARNAPPVVVVDMTGTRFCDSAGLQTLIAAWKRTRAEGGELRLVLPAGGSVWRIMDLTGASHFLPCFAHLEEALAKPHGRADMRRHGDARLAAQSRN